MVDSHEGRGRGFESGGREEGRGEGVLRRRTTVNSRWKRWSGFSKRYSLEKEQERV